MADNSHIATRKRSNPSTSPIKRLYSVLTLNEDNIHKKCMAPSHWVNEEEECVYWPPNGEHPLHYYISKWLSPSPNWQQFPLIKVSLSKGTKERCSICLNMDSELSECPPAGVVLKTSEMIREPSPDLVVKRASQFCSSKNLKSDQCKRRYKTYSNESEGCSSDSLSSPKKVAIQQTKKSKHLLPNIHNVVTKNNYTASASYFQTSASYIQTSASNKNINDQSPRQSSLKQNNLPHPMPNVNSTSCHNDASVSLCQPRPSQTCRLGNYGDPPASFKLMDQRRMQYGLFMELAAIKAGQADIVAKLESLAALVSQTNTREIIDRFIGEHLKHAPRGLTADYE